LEEGMSRRLTICMVWYYWGIAWADFSKDWLATYKERKIPNSL